jgi:hypothetical protein
MTVRRFMLIVAATGRKTEAVHDELYDASGTRRVKDVVVVTPHTTRVLITIIRIREPNHLRAWEGRV